MIYVPPLAARILNRLKLMTVFRVGYTLRILDTKFKIPVLENKEGLFYNLRVDEQFFLTVLQQLIKTRNILFLDAGVNFGQTLLKVKAVNALVSYMGFEPSSLCSYYTSHLIKVNSLEDAKLIRCALADHSGILTLYAPAEGDTRASILDDFNRKEDVRHEENVPAVTLDSMIDLIHAEGKEIILKVDVEGAEWRVFQGAENFISKYMPVVIFENLPSLENSEKQQVQEQISAFFEDRNYELYLLDDSKRRIERIKLINNKNEYTITNYLAVPSGKAKLFPGLINQSNTVLV